MVLEWLIYSVFSQNVIEMVNLQCLGQKLYWKG